MGSPSIFSGRRTKLLTADGILNSDGSINDNNGPINYIKNSHAEVNSAGWVTYADAAATSPVDGIGGAPSSTFARSTSSPLRGTGSFLWTKSAANRQGEGFSYDFTIDSSDKGKVLQVSFEYLIASGTFADNDMSVWIYDVTNTVLIQPAPYLIKNSTLIEKFGVEFQSAINSTSYRLIVHTGSTSAVAYTMQFDNFFAGVGAKLFGSPVADAKAVTFTGTWIANSTYTAYVSRVGDKARFTGTVLLSGAPTTASLSLTMPAGYVIDTAKLPASNVRSVYGSTSIRDASAGTTPGAGYVVGTDSTTVALTYSSSGAIAAITESAPMVFATSDSVYFEFEVPIVGWSSSQVMSNDADTRVVALSANTVASTVITNANAGTTKLIPTVVAKDTHGAYNSSTGVYTVPSPGEYTVYFKSYISMASGMQSLAVYVNGARVAYGTTAYGATTLESDVRYQGTMKAGDTIDIRTNQVSGSGTATIGNNNATGDLLQIAKLSGPAQIAASESVSAIYTGAPPTGSLGGAFNTVIYGTKVKDSHGAYNPSTGIYTVPVSGTYSISSYFSVTGTRVLNTYDQIAINVDGTNIVSPSNYAGGAISGWVSSANVQSYPLLQGQQVKIQSYTTATGPAFESAAGRNLFSITRTGNY